MYCGFVKDQLDPSSDRRSAVHRPHGVNEIDVAFDLFKVFAVTSRQVVNDRTRAPLTASAAVMCER